jgi:7-cyano-7-deazaguanine synthase
MIVLLSGGVDSAVLLWLAKSRHDNVTALTFDYGQRHVKEINRAGMLADVARVRIECVRLPAGTVGCDAAALPLGSVVPNRNMVMLSVAGAVAVARKDPHVAYATNADDHRVYPDCRPAFVNACRATLALCYDGGVELWTPFVSTPKSEVVRIGRELGVPLSLTWSCYAGGAVHCGTCSACVTRRNAFRVAGIEDATTYATEAE